jgi:RNA polymerase sigma-70 factor (ECF subfamily)
VFRRRSDLDGGLCFGRTRLLGRAIRACWGECRGVVPKKESDRERFGVGEENQLIDRALQGERDAFAQLVELNQDRLFASMLQITCSPDEAEEVVQEAFIRAFIKLDTFQRNSQFFTWLYRIAFNAALTRRRRKRARVSLDQCREDNGLEVSDTGDAVDEPMLREERIAMVREALQTLTEEHRAILVLREMQENSYEEIAEILDISIGTVRSRLSRSRRQLKLALEAMQRAEEPKG